MKYVRQKLSAIYMGIYPGIKNMGCTPVPKTKPFNSKRLEPRSSISTDEFIRDFNKVCPQCVYKRILGNGRYGQVFLAEVPEARQQVAIKAIPTATASMGELMQEVEILSEVDHPNIVKYFKHYQSEKYLYVVMEYCEGQDLYKKILEKGRYSENEVRTIMEKLLRVINHCHHLGILHRDLKPENVIYSIEGILKVIDFGLSTKLDAFSCDGLAGTTYYIAPEVLKSGTYTKACDIWSLGIMMHVVLTECVPVGGNNIDNIQERIKNYKGPNYKLDLWNGISLDAKDLLKKMLNPDYGKRITAAEALRHPWFTTRRENQVQCDTSVVYALKKYSEFPENQKDLLEIITKNIRDAKLKKYQDTFLELDKEKTGLITSSDLDEALPSSEKITREELEELVRKINPKGDNFINYSDFITALVATTGLITDEMTNTVTKLLEKEKSSQQL